MKPYKPIKIYRWLSENKQQLYIFNNSDDNDVIKDAIIIKEYIYIDDNIEDALNKIAIYINNYHDNSAIMPYYIWTTKKAISHNIKNIIWDGYNVNPYLSKDRNSKKLEEPISYIYNTNDIFNLSTLNIVFSSDVPKTLENNKYYFIKKKLPKYINLKKRDEKLYELLIQDVTYLNQYPEKYHRVDLYYKLKKSIILSNIFDNMHTNKNIAMIQWINDNSKILYKIQKNHFIKKEQLYNWCNIDKITKTNCINIYYIIAKSCYCKLTIDSNGYILFSYIFDIRKAIKWEIIIKSRKFLTNYLKKYINQPIKMKELSLKLNVSYIIDNSDMNNLISKISKYIDIFNVKVITEKDKNKLVCIYKRSSNYNQITNINDYIKSRYDIGISRNEIIAELINLGITDNIENDVDSVLDNINMKFPEKDITNKNIKDYGTIVIITKSHQGYDIDITNSANYNEVNYLLFWLSKIISSTRIIKKKVGTIQQPIIKEKKELEQQIAEDNEEDNEINRLGELDFDLDSDDDEVAGGAIGKEKHSYFVDLIREVDKDLVGENYARDKCQSDFQPIVLTKKELEKLRSDKMLHFDNILEYGSNKSKLNYYVCPKLWCPISKIPLDIKKDGEKCPIENEEPMELIWGKDKNKPRYSKIIKPNEKGICAPCCGKKLQKKSELDKCKIYDDEIMLDDITTKPETSKTKEATKEDTKENVIDKTFYLMNQRAPIENGRYGSIPEILHNLLYPSVSYDICSKHINKTQKCFIRKGIKHRNEVKNDKYNIKTDSLMYSLAHQLNFKSKNAFINDIENKLDIITYISLENGEICKAFMDMREVIPEDNNKLIKKINKKHDTSKLLDNNINLSRLLNIYKSYYKFIDYLSSDDYPTEKLPYYLYSLISTLYNLLLVIWEHSENDINIICPYYTSYNDLMLNLDINPDIIMLIKDNRYYEPIELKLKNNDSEKIVNINSYNNVKNIIKECSDKAKKEDRYITFNKLITFNQWIINNKKYYKYAIDRILINSNLTISHAITKNNILLSFDNISISLLPKIIKEFDIKKVIFYDDIINKSYDKNTIDKNLLNMFSIKCKEFNINFEAGKIIDNQKTYYNTILTIPDINLKNDIIIHTNYKNDFYKYIENENINSKEWFKIQKLIADVLTKKYTNETFVKEYANINNRELLINKLYKNLFSTYNNKNKIRIILEELPLNNINNNTINDIKMWINNIILYYKYDFFNSIIQEYKTELIFSQNALYINEIYEIPNILLQYHKAMPNTQLNIQYDYNDYTINNNNISNDNIKLPSIFSGNQQLLKTKWTTNKKSKWSNMVLLKNTNYNLNTFSDFTKWLSNILNIYISYDDIISISKQYYQNIIIDNNAVEKLQLFEDPSLFNLWSKITNTKYISVSKFLTDYFNKLDNSHRIDIINKIFDKKELYPNDIIVKSISDVFNISILLIHRGKYGSFDSNIDKRNSLDDLILSSTFIQANKNYLNRPLFIFSKDKNKDNTYYSYYSIIEKTTDITIDSLYMKYKDIPIHIKTLLDAHIKLNVS